MKAFDHISILKELCRTHNKWGMYIHFDWDYVTPDEIKRDAPYLDFTRDEDSDIISHGVGYLLFDSEEECRKYYRMTRGDDDGGVVYALTVSNEGVLQDENT